MTTATDTREDHLIDAATRADDVVVLHTTTTPIHLDRDDLDLVKGVQLLKVGTFNGVVEITAEDLDLFAARFHELSPSVFVPPMRIDHSWDVLSVVGWFEDLYVQTAPDPTNDDAPTPYLVGDFRIVGTEDERQRLREWIRGGKLRNRSSEIMAYRTNTGREYARVFAGCAFVDIPAVEGLAPIQLRTGRATLDTVRTDTKGGAAVADSTEQDRTEDETVVTPATSADSASSAESAETPDEADDGITVGDAEPEDDDEDETEEEGQEEHLQAAGFAAVLRAAGIPASDPKATELRDAFTREVARERTADERLTRYRDKGIIPLSVKDRVEALLRHDDDDVRDSVAALLDLASPRVPLRDHAGTQTSERTSDDDTTTTPEELRELTGTEFGNAWAALTSEQRKDPAYLAAYNEAMGTTDVFQAPRS